MKLKDKTFIITGASSGMGKGIALEFTEQGAKLVLSGRNSQRGKAMESEIRNGNGEAVFLAGDVGDEAYNQELVKLAISTFGKLEGVVTNAGVLGLGSLTAVPLETWRETFRTNVDSVYFLLKHAIPEMQKQNNGVIVLNSSIAAFKSFPNHAAYCASKAALVALGRQLSVDYAPHIRVNSMCPGPVDTPFLHDSAQAFPVPEVAVSKAEQATLLKRLGQPRDIAKLALFLASEDSSWITGSAFTIDGGILAGG